MTDLSPEAKELLRQARTAFSPPEARLEAVRTAIAAQIAAYPLQTSSISPATSSVATRAVGAAGWSAGHAIGAGVLIGALGAGGVMAWLLADRPDRAPAAQVEAALEPSPASEVAPLPVEESALEPEMPGDSIPTPTWQASPADLAPSSKLSPASRDRTRPPVRLRSRAETGTATDSLAEEVSMLRSARAALDRGDAVQAMRMLDAHATRFHRGTLYEERLATRVQALCALGRIDAARSTAQELERAAPRSPHLPRVRASCITQSTK
jgi:hypothetical protein